MAENSFENLTHSGIFKVNSKEDRNIALSLDVFGGHTAFAIFTTPGARPWKLSLNRTFINVIKTLALKIRAYGAPIREAINIQDYDQDAKKWNQIGHVALGIDDNMTFVIDIGHKDLPSRYQFPVKIGGRFDLSTTTLTEKEQVAIAIDTFIEAVERISIVAERLTSQKRTGGNSNRNNNGGGNRNSGGYNQNRQSSQPPASPTFGGGDNNAGGGSDNSDLYV